MLWSCMPRVADQCVVMWAQVNIFIDGHMKSKIRLGGFLFPILDRKRTTVERRLFDTYTVLKDSASR